MKLRIFTEPQQGGTYDDLLAVAKATEDLGFDAFFRSDHYLHMGADPGLPGSTDAWTTLAGLARETSRIRLGTLVTPVTFRHPGPLAVTVAGVDQMSGGRVELGLGAGWFEAEHRAYGLPFPALADRFGLLSEQVQIIDGLWQTPADQTYDFAGEHYTIEGSPGRPKPVQARLPIILGGSGKRRSAALAARYAAEYNVGFSSVARSGEVFDRVRLAVTEAGRPAEEMTYSVAQTVCAGKDAAEFERRAAAIGREPDELRRNGLAGSPAEIVDKIGSYTDIGVTRVYLQVMDLADLDHLELLASSVLSQF
ncbi:LLM class F420-dependent oxidoreductase [Jatrophihabitans sp. DSM 45814]